MVLVVVMRRPPRSWEVEIVKVRVRMKRSSWGRVVKTQGRAEGWGWSGGGSIGEGIGDGLSVGDSF